MANDNEQLNIENTAPTEEMESVDTTGVEIHTDESSAEVTAVDADYGAEQIQIRVLVLLGVEEIHDAERIVVPVDAQQYARVVGHLKACEHVRGGSAGGEYIPSGLALQPGIDLQEGHDRGKSRLLLEAAIAVVHIHGFEHVHHLLLAPPA